MIPKIFLIPIIMVICSIPTYWYIDSSDQVINKCNVTGEIEVFDVYNQTCFLNNCTGDACIFHTCYCEFNITSIQWEFDHCERDHELE